MKTSFASLLLVAHIIAGILLMTTPTWAQSTTIVTTEKVESFKLLSTSAAASTVEWPRVVSVTTYVGGSGDTDLLVPLWCVVITTVVVIVVGGVFVRLIIKTIRCINGLNPTNRLGTNFDAGLGIRAGGINVVTGTNSPSIKFIESDPSMYNIFTSTNLQDWVPYLSVSNVVQQMADGACRLVSTVYKDNMPVLTNKSWLNFTCFTGQYSAITTSDFTSLVFDFKGSDVGFVGMAPQY